MLIQETKIYSWKMEEILNKIKPKYEQVTLDDKGSARGIAILWNPAEVIKDLWIGMPKILTRKFRLIGQSEWFLVSTVYGPHTPVDRGSFIIHTQKLGNMHKE